MDNRSLTLPKALKAAFKLRAVAILLECVEDAKSNSFVRNLVDGFSSQCGFRLTETVLKLEDIWVSRRSRWWCLLTAPFLGDVQLHPFPASEHPSIPRHLFTSPLDLPESELAQLRLQGDELEWFLQFEPNFGRMLLSLDRKAPTALHSWLLVVCMGS